MIEKACSKVWEQSKLWYQIRKVSSKICRSTDGRISGSSDRRKQQIAKQLSSVNTSLRGIKAKAEAICSVFVSVDVVGISS